MRTHHLHWSGKCILYTYVTLSPSNIKNKVGIKHTHRLIHTRHRKRTSTQTPHPHATNTQMKAQRPPCKKFSLPRVDRAKCTRSTRLIQYILGQGPSSPRKGIKDSTVIKKRSVIVKSAFGVTKATHLVTNSAARFAGIQINAQTITSSG